MMILAFGYDASQKRQLALAFSFLSRATTVQRSAVSTSLSLLWLLFYAVFPPFFVAGKTELLLDIGVLSACSLLPAASGVCVCVCAKKERGWTNVRTLVFCSPLLPLPFSFHLQWFCSFLLKPKQASHYWQRQRLEMAFLFLNANIFLHSFIPTYFLVYIRPPSNVCVCLPFCDRHLGNAQGPLMFKTEAYALRDDRNVQFFSAWHCAFCLLPFISLLLGWVDTAAAKRRTTTVKNGWRMFHWPCQVFSRNLIYWSCFFWHFHCIELFSFVQ